MIDVNVSVSRWPFRRLPDDEPENLVRRLERLKVTEAWAGSYDALLHQDVGGVNLRLVETCRSQGGGILRPFGTVNPLLPDWQEELRRCHEDHQMPGIRLHPNYHGYTLDNPLFAELMSAAAKRGLIVQIALKMLDERTLHPLLKNLPTTSPAPLEKLLTVEPKPKIVLLNGGGGRARRLLATGAVSIDISTVEGAAGLERLVKQIGHEHIVFGSQAPLFYAEAAHMKLKESVLTPEQTEAITHTNAERLKSKRT
jgi:predicted TIM-barrel fold metal-dependent hydrolase